MTIRKQKSPTRKPVFLNKFIKEGKNVKGKKEIT